jgi:hypothetical protein
MQCPKCKFEHEAQTVECLRCGIIFRKYVPESELAEAAPLTAAEEATLQTGEEDRKELILRICGIPSALLLARLAVYVAPSAVRILSMWVHEFGHAVAAWLCGFSAMPGPWFTSVDPDRSRATTVLFVGLIGFGGFRAWQKNRWFWIGACAAVLVLLLVCTAGLYSDQAQQLIIFGGDAGCFVLGSVLMLTFYARRDHPIYRNALRWGFLAIGALSFMDAWATWSGGLQNVPFGENENGMSDPSVLTELYSWNVHVLIARYYKLAVFCLMALTVVYAAGIAGPLLRRWEPNPENHGQSQDSTSS